jgi:FkbM family methyltransferase
LTVWGKADKLQGRGLGRRLKEILQREDFRRNPLKALWRRFLWKLRWQFINKPWELKFKKDLRITVAKDGLGSMLFYQGFSEPETEDFFVRFLKPGMVVIDVGAHVGKYTLLGARAVGPEGEVHAFEPNPEVFGLLERNVQINGLRNAFLHKVAVSDKEGEYDFEICEELTVSSFPKRATGRRVRKVVQVRCVALDPYFASQRRQADLVKVDVEGAELSVFRGAQHLLGLPAGQAPAWLFEFSPNNFGHFGYEPAELLEFLQRFGYWVWRYQGEGRIIPFQLASEKKHTLNLLAIKGSPRALAQI